MKSLVISASLFIGISAQAHLLTPVECNAGAGVFKEAAMARDQGMEKKEALRIIDEMIVKTQGTEHVIDKDDAAMFHEYIDLIFSHPEISSDDVSLRFYKVCKGSWEAQHPPKND